MNATVLEVAKNASQATDTAEQAKHKAQEGWKNHQYIPYPASWLRGLRWQDDVATVRVQQDLFGGHSKLQQHKGSLHDQLLNKAKESRGKNG